MNLWTTILASALTSTAILAIAAFIGRALVGGSISHIFNRRLEKYKHELNQFSERLRFDQERKSTDFSLYIRLKHEKYSKLYELILIANGKLMALYGFRKELTFEEYTKQDMERHLEHNHVVAGHIPNLLSNWEIDKVACLAEVRKYLRMIEFQSADVARYEAKNYIVVNALYVSEKVEDTVNQIFDKMVRLYVTWDLERENGPGSRDEVNQTRGFIVEKDNLIEELKKQMRNELSIGAVGYDQ